MNLSQNRVGNIMPATALESVVQIAKRVVVQFVQSASAICAGWDLEAGRTDWDIGRVEGDWFWWGFGCDQTIDLVQCVLEIVANAG